MAYLFDSFESGVPLYAGTSGTGYSSTGGSEYNLVVQRLNSISNDNNTITGSLISGTNITGYLGSLYVGDHSSDGDEDMVVNVCYGTDATPPAANTTTIGTLYIQYTA